MQCFFSLFVAVETCSNSSPSSCCAFRVAKGTCSAESRPADGQIAAFRRHVKVECSGKECIESIMTWRLWQRGYTRAETTAQQKYRLHRKADPSRSQTRTCLGENGDVGHGSWGDLKTGMTVLAKVRSNVTDRPTDWPTEAVMSWESTFAAMSELWDSRQLVRKGTRRLRSLRCWGS
jgi:hypothetical protein